MRKFIPCEGKLIFFTDECCIPQVSFLSMRSCPHEISKFLQCGENESLRFRLMTCVQRFFRTYQSFGIQNGRSKFEVS